MDTIARVQTVTGHDFPLLSDRAAAKYIAQQFYAKIPMPFEYEELVQIISEDWKQFVAQDPDWKNRWHIKRKLTHLDIGWFEKNGEKKTVPKNGEYYDNKEYFHYADPLPALMESQGVLTPTWRNWLNAFARLRRICEDRTLTLWRLLDQAVPGYDFERNAFDPRGSEKDILRMLWYREDINTAIRGQVYGKCHTDKNAGTLHLADSYEGLYLEVATPEDPAKRLYSYAVEPGTALFFLGDKTERLTHRQLEAVCHGIHFPEHIARPTTQRWTLVYFDHTDIHINDGWKSKNSPDITY